VLASDCTWTFGESVLCVNLIKKTKNKFWEEVEERNAATINATIDNDDNSIDRISAATVTATLTDIRDYELDNRLATGSFAVDWETEFAANSRDYLILCERTMDDKNVDTHIQFEYAYDDVEVGEDVEVLSNKVRINFVAKKNLTVEVSERSGGGGGLRKDEHTSHY